MMLSKQRLAHVFARVKLPLWRLPIRSCTVFYMQSFWSFGCTDVFLDNDGVAARTLRVYHAISKVFCCC